MTSYEKDDLKSYWTLVHNIFDPREPLRGPQLESCYVVREESPLPKLLLALQPERVPQKVLLTGQRGSGKTSALIRLAHQLGADYLVVWIDLEGSLDLYGLSILELLLALGGGIFKVAQEADLQPDPLVWSEMIAALNTIIERTQETNQGPLDAEAILRGLVCARGDPADPLELPPTEIPQRLELNQYEELRVGPVLREMVSRINHIIADVERKAGRPLLVIADGLDKMARIEAERIFDYSMALLEIKCRTVYTVSYGLYKTRGLARREQFDVRDFPNVKLHPRGQRDTHYQPGFDVMRKVIESRLDALGLSLEDVITQEALENLIWGSGGVMRSLIRLMRYASLEAELDGETRIERAYVDKALEEDRRARAAALREQDLDYLHHFEATGRRREEEIFITQLEDGNIVAYAERGYTWYDVHPNLMPLLE